MKNEINYKKVIRIFGMKNKINTELLAG